MWHDWVSVTARRKRVQLAEIIDLHTKRGLLSQSRWKRLITGSICKFPHAIHRNQDEERLLRIFQPFSDHWISIHDSTVQLWFIDECKLNYLAEVSLIVLILFCIRSEQAPLGEEEEEIDILRGCSFSKMNHIVMKFNCWASKDIKDTIFGNAELTVCHYWVCVLLRTETEAIRSDLFKSNYFFS